MMLAGNDPDRTAPRGRSHLKGQDDATSRKLSASEEKKSGEMILNHGAGTVIVEVKDGTDLEYIVDAMFLLALANNKFQNLKLKLLIWFDFWVNGFG